LSLSDRNIGHNHHIYLNSFYYSVRSAGIWFDRKARVCGTNRANGSFHLAWNWSQAPEGRAVSALEEGDIIVQLDRRFVQMISMFHDATVVNTGRKDRK